MSLRDRIPVEPLDEHRLDNLERRLIARAGEASQSAEDHGLVALDQLCEIIQACQTVLRENCFTFCCY